MGNSESHDYLPVWDPEHKVLDLRHEIDSHNSYIKHLQGSADVSCLTDLPSHILEEISLYESLLASFNCIASLPTPLPLHLPHLSHIDLSHNHLVELPDSFGLLFHLRTVLLNHNRLRRLPDSFCNLHKLEKVDVSHNKLSELPLDMGNLCDLQKLNLSYNRLKRIPQSIIECKCLRVILAKSNSCQEPPQDICELGSQELLKYIKNKFVVTLLCDCGTRENVFNRVRSNQLQSPVLNPKSTKFQYAQIQTETENTPNRIKTPLLLPHNATTLSDEDLKEKIVGLIYGAVIGDALGLATDFMSADECQFYYDSETLHYNEIIMDEHRLHWIKGNWTANADLMLIILDSVIQWAGVVDELDFAQRLVDWHRFGLFSDSSSGYTTSSIINKVLAMKDFPMLPHATAAAQLTNGVPNGVCGEKELHLGTDDASLPYAVILGILHFYNLSEVISNSVRICKATHASEKNIAANVAIACIVALLLQGKHDASSPSSMQELTNLARMLATEHLSDVDDIKQFNSCFNDKFHNSWEHYHPFSALQIAISALHSCKDFRVALCDVIMEGGHSSLNGCLVGAFGGYRTGFAHLPCDWVQGLNEEAATWLNGKINNLLDMMGIP